MNDEIPERVKGRDICIKCGAELPTRGPHCISCGQPIYRFFYSRIAGTIQKNADGTSRQEILKKCSVGQSLELVRERNNPYDIYAVRLYSAPTEQVGYVTQNASGEVGELVDEGQKVEVIISEITGGAPYNLGANLEIRKYRQSLGTDFKYREVNYEPAPADTAENKAETPLTTRISPQPRKASHQKEAQKSALPMLLYIILALLIALATILRRCSSG